MSPARYTAERSRPTPAPTASERVARPRLVASMRGAVLACDDARVVPSVAHMDLDNHVEDVRRQLAIAAEAGGPEARALAERLTAPLDSAVRLTLLDVLALAAAEITRELAPGSVEVRLRGREPDFVVIPPPSDPVAETGGRRRQPPPRPRRRPARPGSRGSTCACPNSSRAGSSRPRRGRACRSTPGWCAPSPPRSTAAKPEATASVARRAAPSDTPAGPADRSTLRKDLLCLLSKPRNPSS